MPIKDLPIHLRPREKAWSQGIENLSEIELLAILLRNGLINKDVLDIAKDLIEEFKSIKNILQAPLKSLEKIRGIGKVKALEFSVINQICLIYHEKFNIFYINNIEDALTFAYPFFLNNEREKFLVILLDSKNKVIYYEIMYTGTKNALSIEPREVVALALQKNAKKIFCFHNHPSDNINPSNADIRTTKQISYYCNNLGILLIDHIVINSKKDYQSIYW